MASQGLGKLRGLTRPGSKIQLPAASDDAGSTSCDTNKEKQGQALVGKVVRKVSTGDDYVEGEVTHYVSASDIYRVSLVGENLKWAGGR